MWLIRKSHVFLLHPRSAIASVLQIVSIYEVLKSAELKEKYNNVLEFGLPDWRQPIYYYRYSYCFLSVLHLLSTSTGKCENSHGTRRCWCSLECPPLRTIWWCGQPTMRSTWCYRRWGVLLSNHNCDDSVTVTLEHSEVAKTWQKEGAWGFHDADTRRFRSLSSAVLWSAAVSYRQGLVESFHGGLHTRSWVLP